MRQEASGLSHTPTISIIMPTHNAPHVHLRSAIESVLSQVYPHWELCIADDASTAPHVARLLREYAQKDERIKVAFREKNGHISAASNSALALATGEFVALLDHDDELRPHALHMVAKTLNQNPALDMIYSDEDKITEEGARYSPYFKPDWSPDTFMCQMYTCHLGVYRRSIVEKIGGFREGFEGSQDYDLVLRFVEQTSGEKIHHIPHVLYHWRAIEGSTAQVASAKSYAYMAALRALQEALDRRGEGGIVEEVDRWPGHYRVRYPVPGGAKISIIIPTRDKPELLSVCLASIFEKSSYDRFEVVVVDNGSVEKETFALFERWGAREPERFRVEHYDIPFNYPRINNRGAEVAAGDLLLFLNNDTEVISPDWLERMAGFAARPSIGAVGAKLLYGDDSIQHAGVVLGIGGVAGHGHLGFPCDSPGNNQGRLMLQANYAAVTAACLMVKRSDFEAVGGFTEELAVAFNDVDFCIKLLMQGRYNILLPEVQLYHYESKSRGYEDTPEKIARFKHEESWMKERWGELLESDPFYNPNLTLEAMDYRVGMCRGRR
jgi:glycosyltransferase involved in cell wall biosynthesis